MRSCTVPFAASRPLLRITRREHVASTSCMTCVLRRTVRSLPSEADEAPDLHALVRIEALGGLVENQDLGAGEGSRPPKPIR